MRLREFGNTEPDPVALAQACCLLLGSYARRTDVPQLLQLEERAVATLFPDDRALPDAVLYRAGEQQYLLVIAGTVNATQLADQGGPLNAMVYLGPEVGEVGLIWHLKAGQIRSWLGTKLPDASAPWRLRIIGHSYGAAVGQLIAWEVARTYGADRVQLLTVGSPRPAGVGYTGAQPAIHWRVESPGDIVTALPDTLLAPTFNTLFLPFQFSIVPVQWHSYGRGVEIRQDGSYGAGEVRVIAKGPGVAEGALDEHRMRNYLGRAVVRVKSMPLDAEAALAAFVGGALLDSPSVPDPLSEWPGNYFGLNDAWIMNLRLLVGGVRADMAASIGGGETMLFKHIWRFRSKSGGTWTEQFAYTSDQSSERQTVPPELIASRLAFLHGSVTLVDITILNQDNPRDAFPVKVNQDGGIAVADSDTPDVRGTAAVMDLRGVQGAKRRIWIRGLADKDVNLSRNGLNSEFSERLSKGFLAWRVQLNLYGYGIQPRVPLAKTGADSRNLLVGIDGAAKPGKSVLTTSRPHGLSIGDKVLVSGTPKKTCPVMDGTYDVLDKTDSTILVNYHTPQGIVIASPKGYVRPFKRAAFQRIIAVGDISGKFQSRKTKSIFTRSRAESSVRGRKTSD